MNYLAHAYLSFNQPDILIGNMISDFIKGKKQFNYPLSIQKGIQLHRAIDQFTDFHPATKEAKKYLAPASGAYSGAFVDVVYDHFLALDNTIYSPEEWTLFAENVYQVLSPQAAAFPDKFQRLLPYMISQNWLYNYRYTAGIENSFRGICYRAIYLKDSNPVFRLFMQNYPSFEQLFGQFFPDVKKFAQARLNELLEA